MRLALKLLVLMHLVSAAAAQDRASIVADEIIYSDSTGEFAAIGNVEVYFEGSVLYTDRLDVAGDTITFSTPSTFVDAQGNPGSSESGETDKRFRNGVLNGVRMLLADQLYVAGSQLKLEDGRYSRIRNAVVTTCSMCVAGETPDWHFRARQLVHDREERQIYMRDVDFVLGKTTLARLPSLRVPDPTVERMSGFLMPIVKYSSEKGVRVRAPYFHTLGNHADMTLTPGATSKGQLSFGAEYRRLFSAGGLTAEGLIVTDRKHEERVRGHVALSGDWEFGQGYLVDFSLEDVTDPAVLSDHDVTDDSEITSSVMISRREARGYGAVRTRYIERFDDEERTLPRMIHEFGWQRRFSPSASAGSFGLNLEALSVQRHATTGPHARDVARGSVDLDWMNSWLLDGGMILSTTAQVQFDHYRVRQDEGFFRNKSLNLQPGADYSRTANRSSRSIAAELRWPFEKVGGDGYQVIEPFAQLVWSPVRDDGEIPDEDSMYLEFDETNLRSLDRFPGRDRNEQGTRLNLGVRHSGRLASGAGFDWMVGGILRNRDNRQFSRASGLSGKRSDLVAAGMLELGGGLTVNQRAVLDSGMDVSKAESLIRFDSEDMHATLGYSRLLKDESKGMTNDVESVLVSGEQSLDDDWWVIGELQYDLNREGDNSAGLQLSRRSRCLLVTFGLDRTLKTATATRAKTKLEFNLSLLGLMNDRDSAKSGCNS